LVRLAVLLLLRQRPEIGFTELVQELNEVLLTLHANGGLGGPVPTIAAATVSRLIRDMDYSWVVRLTSF
jgi:hypothetical protein